MEFNSTIVSNALILLFVLDPFGNVPMLGTVLRHVDRSRHRVVILREMVFGLGFLLAFLFGGDAFLGLFHLETEAVQLAGAIILFIVAIRLIFTLHGDGALYGGTTSEPFIVPIALPMLAGPSALATLLVMSRASGTSMREMTIAVLIAWGIAALVFCLEPVLTRVMKDKGMQAMEKLMGMLLLILAVQMTIDGVRALIEIGP